MSHAAKISTTEVIWIGGRALPDGYVRYAGEVSERMVWDAQLGNVRPMTPAEVLQAVTQEKTERQESDTARADAKRALSALDAIIAGAPTATTAQMRTAVEQMARIIKHLAIATVGR